MILPTCVKPCKKPTIYGMAAALPWVADSITALPDILVSSLPTFDA